MHLSDVKNLNRFFFKESKFVKNIFWKFLTNYFKLFMVLLYILILFKYYLLWCIRRIEMNANKNFFRCTGLNGQKKINNKYVIQYEYLYL